MLSLRLTPELEDQLAHHSLRTGLSKNQIVMRALNDFLSHSALKEVSLKGPVLEAELQIFKNKQADIKDLYQKAHEVASWVSNKAIWTKKFDPKSSGDPTPGAYGRNVVIGFTDSFDSLHIISRNLATESTGGTDRYHLYVTDYDDWLQYMEIRPQVTAAELFAEKMKEHTSEMLDQIEKEVGIKSLSAPEIIALSNERRRKKDSK